MSETKYIVIKREECTHDARYLTTSGCQVCPVEGYTDTEVDLADALRDLFVSDMSFNLKVRQALENC